MIGVELPNVRRSTPIPSNATLYMFSRQTGSYVRLTTQSNDARTSIHAYQQSITAGAAARRYIIRRTQVFELESSIATYQLNLS